MSKIEFGFAMYGTREICHLCGGVTEKFEMCAEGEAERWRNFVSVRVV